MYLQGMEGRLTINQTSRDRVVYSHLPYVDPEPEVDEEARTVDRNVFYNETLYSKEAKAFSGVETFYK